MWKNYSDKHQKPSQLNKTERNMSKEHFFVTGATGCIGSWVVRNLLLEDAAVTVLDVGDNRHRLMTILEDEQLSKVQFIHGDIANLKSVEQILDGSEITHVIHLAALQLPFCKTNPSLGAMVNVVGTVNVFEACKNHNIKKIAYASSTAVYGPVEAYPQGPIPHNAPLLPRSHYGVYKVANEGNARVYWLENGITSIALRPHTVYGPGRDQGMTSTPTKAMISALLGRPYKISFGGSYGFQFVDDVAKIFIRASRTTWEGADGFSLGGVPTSTTDVIAAIETCLPNMRGKITYDNTPLPFSAEFENSALVSILGELPNTPLLEGVKLTIDSYRKAIESDCLSQAEIVKILE
jgi:nucleoside-diphosphate-sugar epimerase